MLFNIHNFAILIDNSANNTRTKRRKINVPVPKEFLLRKTFGVTLAGH